MKSQHRRKQVAMAAVAAILSMSTACPTVTAMAESNNIENLDENNDVINGENEVNDEEEVNDKVDKDVDNEIDNEEEINDENNSDDLDESIDDISYENELDLQDADIALYAVDDVFEVGSLTYKVLSADTVQVGDGDTAMTGLSGSVTIPSSVKYGGTTYNVTAIGDKAFLRCSDITFLEIPDTVTAIGRLALADLNVNTITIPDSVETLGDNVLSGATMTSVTLSSKLRTIPDRAFNSCPNLREVTIPDSVTKIETYAFNSCSSLTTITIPKNVEYIGKQAFWSSALTNVTIEGNSLTEIDDLAFAFCESLKTINIPSSIETIGEQAFQHCGVLKTTGLETGTSNLTSIGTEAFSSTMIKSISIPSTCTDINKNAFTRCSKLQEINVDEENSKYSSEDGILYDKNKETLYLYPAAKTGSSYTTPDGLKTIGAYAFEENQRLRDVTITDGVETIERSAFQGAGVETVIMPDSVTSIGELAFYNSKSLSEITLSKNLKEILDYIFYNCSSLSEIEIPASVKKIGTSILYGCESLEKVTIKSPELTSISSSAFSGTPDDVEFDVETNAIKNMLIDTCGVSADNITSAGKDPKPSIENFTLDGIYYKVLSDPTDTANGTVQVGSGYSGSFEVTLEMANLVTIPETVTEEATGNTYTVIAIGENAFAAAWDSSWEDNRPSRIKNISIPKTVTSIGKNAFYNASNLETITFAEGSQLTSIGENTFDTCTSLKEIALPDGFKTIGEAAFADCKALKTATVGNTLEEIGTEAFKRSGLESINLPATLKTIGTDAFYECNSLKSINVSGTGAYTSEDGVLLSDRGKTLLVYPAAKTTTEYTVPDSVEAITDKAFYGNTRIIELNTGKNTKTIGKNAFGNMSALTTLTMENSVESLGEMAFYFSSWSSSSKLESVTLSEKLKSLPKYCFRGCNSLEELTIPKSVELIDSDSIPSSVENVTIKSTGETSESLVVKSANTSAKYRVATESVKAKLVEYGVPEANITVDDTLLEDGVKEPSFTKNGISYTVTADPTETEPGVVSIESVDKTVVNKAGDYTIAGTVRNNGYNYVVKEIKASAFNGCDNIESITVPNTVEKLGVNAIAGNLNLKSITFETGSKLTTIENGALSDNGKLEAITIPASVKNIGDYILGWNYSLATVEFEEGTTLDNIGKGMLFRDEALSSITLPSTVTVINDEAFYNCKALIEIDLSNIDEIGAYAFYNCASLKEAILSNDVTELNDAAFYGCSSLEKVKLSEKLTKLGDLISEDAEEDVKGVFSGCTSLKEIVIPKGVNTIGKNTFNGCENLRRVIIETSSLKKVGANAFNDVSPEAVFVVKNNAAKDELISGGNISKDKIIVTDELESILKKAENAKKSSYTTDKYETLVNEINNAKDILSKLDTVTPEEFNNAVDSLTTAYNDKKKDNNSGSHGGSYTLDNITGENKNNNNNKPSTEEPDNAYDPKDASNYVDIINHYAYTYVKDAIEEGLIKGDTATAFNPDRALSRQEAVYMLYMLDGADYSGNSVFTDVYNNNPYADAIMWAYENGIVSGIGDGLFAPTANVTREQMAAFIYRYFTFKGIDASDRAAVTGFNDYSSISEYAIDNISWAVAKGIYKGRTDNTIAPKDNITKAEAAITAQNIKGIL
ncbi:leucine-rich repeat protein [Anaerotignum sp. MSJ-24]|uniref:leucine-rich repeat protein n=1 Tax=Anaerotignum sp. MSJ-24 TaxID=2841521 RepID=UPI001C0FEA67|nr:leucine-rich repeat protein [Anaerotignum sp. MSJ-24]MBU5464044.1 leucine-rich repeat protein [Anaerotignum sp. MSJ-24]